MNMLFKILCTSKLVVNSPGWRASSPQHGTDPATVSRHRTYSDTCRAGHQRSASPLTQTNVSQVLSFSCLMQQWGWLTASSNSFPELFLLEDTLVGVRVGAGDGEGEEDGDGTRVWTGDTGDGGRGAFSSCSISFSSFIRPGGSMLYLHHGNRE